MKRLFGIRPVGYVSGSRKTKWLLNELNANVDNGDEPEVITKSMRPEDVTDVAVPDLLASMEDAEWRAMRLYVKLLRARDAAGS
jgi:hypothetical protein